MKTLGSVACLAVLCAAHPLSAGLRPENLRCEYLHNPLAVEADAPRLSWEVASDQRAERQTACQILVASSPQRLARNQGDLWDTGRLNSDQTLHHEYGGRRLAPRAQAWWKVRVAGVNGKFSAWSAPATWRMGLCSPEAWQSRWISHDTELAPVVPRNAGGTTNNPEALPATMLRREFALRSRPVRALLYATALGVYEARLNGQRVGDHVLAPEWTDYRRRVQYQAYDVTELVREGTNCLAAHLGDGWFAGRLGMSDSLFGMLRGVYGRKPWFLAQLELEFPDGTRQVVATDATWRATREGPLRSSDLLDGEVYDARREQPGWDRPGFAASGWTPVAERALESGPPRVAQPNEPIRVVETLAPAAMWSPAPRTHVLDFGQNLVGRCRLRLRGTGESTVVLRHAEMTNADGSVYLANLRGAPQVDRITLPREGVLDYEPLFTHHGFRFLEISNLEQPPAAADVRALVFNSAAEEVGTFECSDPMLTKLWRNILWTQRANLMSVPTDCPQRDERLGWMGDIQAFGQTAIYQMDMAAFFTKWLQDVRDAQADDGRFPDFAPHPYAPNERFSGAPAWADAGVLVPWRCYVNYGDRRLLTNHLAAARRWIDYVRQRNPDGIWRNARGNDYNDWLNGDTLRRDGWPTQGGTVPPEVFATAFHQHSTALVDRMARLVAPSELPPAPPTQFAAAFLDNTDRLPRSTQAGYALALDFDLVPPERIPGVVSNLVEALHAYGGRLSTGIQSTHRMLLALSRHGRPDLAWRLVTSHEFPSWGYMIDNGATTIWERWDGFVAGRGFQDAGMNSFNHWALGSVGEWLMRHGAGIAQGDESIAWRSLLIAPQPGGGVTWARASYHSIRGPIRTAWRLTHDRLHLEVDIPANTTATVQLDGARDAASVTESGRPLARLRGVRWVQTQAGLRVDVGSGRYTFEWARRPPAMGIGPTQGG